MVAVTFLSPNLVQLVLVVVASKVFLPVSCNVNSSLTCLFVPAVNS